MDKFTEDVQTAVHALQAMTEDALVKWQKVDALYIQEWEYSRYLALFQASHLFKSIIASGEIS